MLSMGLEHWNICPHWPWMCATYSSDSLVWCLEQVPNIYSQNGGFVHIVMNPIVESATNQQHKKSSKLQPQYTPLIRRWNNPFRLTIDAITFNSGNIQTNSQKNTNHLPTEKGTISQAPPEPKNVHSQSAPSIPGEGARPSAENFFRWMSRWFSAGIKRLGSSGSYNPTVLNHVEVGCNYHLQPFPVLTSNVQRDIQVEEIVSTYRHTKTVPVPLGAS